MLYLSIAFLVIVIVIIAMLSAVHVGFRAPRRIERSNPADHGVVYEEVRIRTVGGKRLYAWWLPAAEPAATLVILHGWGGNIAMMLPLALPLHQAGLNILLPDARNHGSSDSAGFSSLPRFAEDAGAAVDWARVHSRDPRQRVALLGHSVGGGAVLLEASRRNDIAAVISIAAFANPQAMTRRYLEQFRIPCFCIPWMLRYIEWVIGHRFADIAPVNTVGRVNCPVLLVHGTADETVPLTDAQLIREHSRGKNAELLLIEGGGHDSVKQVEPHADQLIAFLERAGIACQSNST